MTNAIVKDGVVIALTDDNTIPPAGCAYYAVVGDSVKPGWIVSDGRLRDPIEVANKPILEEILAKEEKVGVKRIIRECLIELGSRNQFLLDTEAEIAALRRQLK